MEPAGFGIDVCGEAMGKAVEAAALATGIAVGGGRVFAGEITIPALNNNRLAGRADERV